MKSTDNNAPKDTTNNPSAAADLTIDSESVAVHALAEMGIGLWAFELDENCPPRMYGNRQMDALMGCDGTKLTPEEYYHAWFDNVHPNHIAEINKAVGAMIAGKLSEVQYPFRHPTRGEMWVRCGGKRDPLYTKGIRIIGRHQDVSELIHVQKVADAEHVHAKLCAEAYEAIYTHDSVEAFLKCFAPRLLATMDADQVIFCPIDGEQIMFSRPGLESTDGTVQSVLADTIHICGVASGRFAIRYLQKQHEFTVYERATFKSIVRSLSWSLERRREEKARGQFFASVTHDIRTPLNAIVGFSEILEMGVTDEGERDRYIAAIRTSGKMLARLVNDFLDFSKLENGKMEILNEPTDLATLTREVAATFDFHKARSKVALRMEIDPLPRLLIDPQRIQQILYNFTSNAMKYTHEGSVTIRVTWRGGVLRIEVKDTGEGIAPKNINRILRPFEQVTDANHRTGTGLGLPICQKLVRLMGGTLSVRSKLGEGSTFAVEIPNVAAADGETPAPADKDAPVTHEAKDLRVLIVDDSSVNLMVLKALLKRCDITDVTLAANGKEALERLRADKAFDVVLTDMRMPVMDGGELVAAIRADAKLAHLPVYLLTADVEMRSEHAAKGFTGILLKPLTTTALHAIFGR